MPFDSTPQARPAAERRSPGRRSARADARPASGALVLALAAIAMAVVACGQQFKLTNYRTNQALYQAAMREFGRGRWDNAILAFQQLTRDLPARDTLLPRAEFYLGKAHQRRDEFILAAQSFIRLAESFPDDTLADDAWLEAARSHSRIWRRPSLDATYGRMALDEFNRLIELYPESPMRAEAEREVRRLQEWFATKDYETGLHYYRRRAYDSAIIYFKDVVEKHPETAKAREAQLRLVESYRAIRYREDANEVCASLRQSFPSDREVRETCGAAPAQNATAPPARPDTAAL